MRASKEASGFGGTGNMYTRIPKTHYNKEPEKKPGTIGSERKNKPKIFGKQSIFPTFQKRLISKIILTTKMSAVLTGRGKKKASLHRFHLSEEVKFIFGKEYQTTDHILSQCVNTCIQHEGLKQKIGTWPACKESS